MDGRDQSGVQHHHHQQQQQPPLRRSSRTHVPTRCGVCDCNMVPDAPPAKRRRVDTAATSSGGSNSSSSHQQTGVTASNPTISSPSSSPPQPQQVTSNGHGSVPPFQIVTTSSVGDTSTAVPPVPVPAAQNMDTDDVDAGTSTTDPQTPSQRNSPSSQPAVSSAVSTAVDVSASSGTSTMSSAEPEAARGSPATSPLGSQVTSTTSQSSTSSVTSSAPYSSVTSVAATVSGLPATMTSLSLTCTSTAADSTSNTFGISTGSSVNNAAPTADSVTSPPASGFSSIVSATAMTSSPASTSASMSTLPVGVDVQPQPSVVVSSGASPNFSTVSTFRTLRENQSTTSVGQSSTAASPSDVSLSPSPSTSLGAGSQNFTARSPSDVNSASSTLLPTSPEDVATATPSTSSFSDFFDNLVSFDTGSTSTSSPVSTAGGIVAAFGQTSTTTSGSTCDVTTTAAAVNSSLPLEVQSTFPVTAATPNNGLFSFSASQPASTSSAPFSISGDSRGCTSGSDSTSDVSPTPDADASTSLPPPPSHLVPLFPSSLLPPSLPPAGSFQMSSAMPNQAQVPANSCDHISTSAAVSTSAGDFPTSSGNWYSSWTMGSLNFTAGSQVSPGLYTTSMVAATSTSSGDFPTSSANWYSSWTPGSLNFTAGSQVSPGLSTTSMAGSPLFPSPTCNFQPKISAFNSNQSTTSSDPSICSDISAPLHSPQHSQSTSFQTSTVSQQPSPTSSSSASAAGLTSTFEFHVPGSTTTKWTSNWNTTSGGASAVWPMTAATSGFSGLPGDRQTSTKLTWSILGSQPPICTTSGSADVAVPSQTSATGAAGDGSTYGTESGSGSRSSAQKTPTDPTDAVYPGVRSVYIEDLEVCRHGCPLDSATWLPESGRVMVCGSNVGCQLGLSDDADDCCELPTVVERLRGEEIVQVVAAGMHTVCLNTSGQVLTFGCNDEGQLGRATVDDEPCAAPLQVQGLSHVTVVQVSAGDNHTAMLTSDGQVFVCGTFRANTGCTGLLVGVQKSQQPIQILGDQFNVKIASGNNHLATLTSRGQIFTLGGDISSGVLGRAIEETATDELSLTAGRVVITGRPLVQFCNLWAGPSSNFARVHDTGEIFVWGLNTSLFGLEPVGDVIDRPRHAVAFQGFGLMSICPGELHAVALDNKGNVYTVGCNVNGQLGNPERQSVATESRLMRVGGLLTGRKCVAIGCGARVSYAITDEGELYGWGIGTSKQLGVLNGDDDVDVYTPVRIPINDRVFEVSAGTQHTVVLSRPQLTNNNNNNNNNNNTRYYNTAMSSHQHEL